MGRSMAWPPQHFASKWLQGVGDSSGTQTIRPCVLGTSKPIEHSESSGLIRIAPSPISVYASYSPSAAASTATVGAGLPKPWLPLADVVGNRCSHAVLVCSAAHKHMQPRPSHHKRQLVSDRVRVLKH